MRGRLGKADSQRRAGRGLVVRYVTYYTQDAMTEAELAAKFKAAGYKQPIVNVSSGFIVGTIGAWSNDDSLSSGQAGRLFYGTYPLTRPKRDTAFVATYRDKVPASAACTGAPAPPPPPYFLGPIAAWVDAANQKVVLDFSSTIPEVSGVNSPPTVNDLAKANYGDLTLAVRRAGQEQTVGIITYDSYNRAAYELSGGLRPGDPPTQLPTHSARRRELSLTNSWQVAEIAWRRQF
jgi:hypothetical protein